MYDERTIEELLQDDELLNAATAKGVRDALERHRRAGHSVPEWKDGRVVWVTTEELVGRIRELDELLEDRARKVERATR